MGVKFDEMEKEILGEAVFLMRLEGFEEGVDGRELVGLC